MKTKIIILLILCFSVTAANAQTEAVKVPAEVQPFVENGTKPIALESADLNGDGLKDFILVLERENIAEKDEYDFPVNQRPLLILVRGTDKKLSEAKRNEKMVMCSQCGGIFGDPFAGLTVGKNTFTVNHYGGSAWRWTADYKFNYSRIDKTWQLVRIEKTSYHNVRPPEETMEKTVLTPPKDFGKVDINDFDPADYEKKADETEPTGDAVSGKNADQEFPQFIKVSSTADNLITANSAGKVKLGMTVADARKALSGMKLERTSDGDGVALIAVGQGENTMMTLYAGEEDREAKIDEAAIIEFIEVWGKNFQTAEGVKPGMKVGEVEKKYGKVKEIMMSEIESREFATFTKQPNGLQFRVMSEDSTAGIYAEGENKSSAYTPNAYLFSIQVVGANPFDEEFKPDQNAYFSSNYTNLNSDCESSGGEDGGHVSTVCKGIGGYRINYFDSAANLNFSVETFDSENPINLGSQPLSYDTKTRKVEWRLANGRPFAVIMRMNKFETNDEGLPGKITGEYLLVKGLQKFEHIDFEVDAKKPNANEKARESADKAYQEKSVQTKTVQAKRIEFQPDSNSVQTKGVFNAREDRAYFTVKLEKDQRMIVNIIPISEGLATSGVVIAPSGEEDGMPGGFVFNSLLKESGDYKIRVGQRPTDHKFPAEFAVEIILLPEFIVADIVSSNNSAASYKTVDIAEFNKKLAESAAKNEAWVKFPTQVIAKWLPPFEEFGSRRVEMNSEFADVTDFLKVVVTDDQYADDSVRGEKYWVEIKKDAQGVWQIVSAKRAWICQENRGHQDYSIAPCL